MRFRRRLDPRVEEGGDKYAEEELENNGDEHDVNGIGRHIKPVKQGGKDVSRTS